MYNKTLLYEFMCAVQVILRSHTFSVVIKLFDLLQMQDRIDPEGLDPGRKPQSST